jgi:hypothetical protein
MGSALYSSNIRQRESSGLALAGRKEVHFVVR